LQQIPKHKADIILYHSHVYKVMVNENEVLMSCVL